MATNVALQMAQAEFLANMAQDPQLAPEDHEGFRRLAAHAAYYACYTYALDWAVLRGFKKPTGWSFHEGLWSCWYAQEPETEDIRIAGEGFHAKRIRADYKTKLNFNDSAKDMIDEANELLDLINEDITRVKALPAASLKIAWTVSGHPRSKRKSTKKKGS